VSASATEQAMTTHVSATLIDGVFKPDETVALADQTRVRLTIEPIADRPAMAPVAWQALKARLRERPIHAAGLHFTRDELHERR
jgi:hypothetical protein